MDASTTTLVKAFNALPRNEPNEWYFDVRYIQLEPTPYHALYLMQPQTSVRRIEPLPAGLPAGKNGLVYFPETGRDAAPEVVRAIMYAFLSNMGRTEPPAIAPWRLITPDKVLCSAVKEEFRRIGIHSSLQVGEPSFALRLIADDAFDMQFAALQSSMGYRGRESLELIIPESICFPETADAVPPIIIGKTDWDICTAYVRHMMEARPIDDISDSTSIISRMSKEVRALQEKVKNVPEAVVRLQADNGNYEAALDYGIRLRFGVGCNQDRILSRVYLIKALDPLANPDLFQATVHAALIEWYLDSRKNGVLKNRFMCAAAHHTKSAILCARRADPDRKLYCNAVIGFAKTLIELSEKVDTIGQIEVLYDDLVQVSRNRSKQVEEEKKKLAMKRLKTPHRYCCAAAGCGIQADTGRMLSRCSGKCDVDKKPSYCSKECQKADWKNHKPFCRPGAECSVIDDGTIETPLQGHTSKDGMIQIPVTYADGSTMYFSTSTLEPKLLKEMAESMAKKDSPGGSGMPTAWKIDKVTVSSELNISTS